MNILKGWFPIRWVSKNFIFSVWSKSSFLLFVPIIFFLFYQKRDIVAPLTFDFLIFRLFNFLTFWLSDFLKSLIAVSQRLLLFQLSYTGSQAWIEISVWTFSIEYRFAVLIIILFVVIKNLVAIFLFLDIILFGGNEGAANLTKL